MRNCFPKNRCKTKKIYFMFIIDNEDDFLEDDNKEKEFNDKFTTPYLSFNALKDITRFHTLRVTKFISNPYLL